MNRNNKLFIFKNYHHIMQTYNPVPRRNLPEGNVAH